jgi:hypothetical protein
MSHVSSRTTVLAAVFTFCVASGAPALAKTPTHRHHHHAHLLSYTGYTAAPVIRLLYVPDRNLDGSGDLPSSSVSNDERIAN